MFDKIAALTAAASGAAAISFPLGDAPTTATPPQTHVERMLNAGQEVSWQEMDFLSLDVDALMGAPVVGRERGYVGHVNQLMVSAEGQIHGVVLGVEHFVPGLGTKLVAQPMNALTVYRMGDGSFVVQTDATRSALDDKPAFQPVFEAWKQD